MTARLQASLGLRSEVLLLLLGHWDLSCHCLGDFVAFVFYFWINLNHLKPGFAVLECFFAIFAGLTSRPLGDYFIFPRFLKQIASKIWCLEDFLWICFLKVI